MFKTLLSSQLHSEPFGASAAHLMVPSWEQNFLHQSNLMRMPRLPRFWMWMLIVISGHTIVLQYRWCQSGTGDKSVRSCCLNIPFIRAFFEELQKKADAISRDLGKCKWWKINKMQERSAAHSRDSVSHVWILNGSSSCRAVFEARAEQRHQRSRSILRIQRILVTRCVRVDATLMKYHLRRRELTWLQSTRQGISLHLQSCNLQIKPMQAFRFSLYFISKRNGS